MPGSRPVPAARGFAWYRSLSLKAAGVERWCSRSAGRRGLRPARTIRLRLERLASAGGSPDHRPGHLLGCAPFGVERAAQDGERSATDRDHRDGGGGARHRAGGFRRLVDIGRARAARAGNRPRRLIRRRGGRLLHFPGRRVSAWRPVRRLSDCPGDCATARRRRGCRPAGGAARCRRIGRSRGPARGVSVAAAAVAGAFGSSGSPQPSGPA